MTRYDALWVALNYPEYIHWIALHGDQPTLTIRMDPRLAN